MVRRDGIIRSNAVVSGLLISMISTAAVAQDPLDNAPMAPQSAVKADSRDSEPVDTTTSQTSPKAKPTLKPEFINKTAAEWRRLLTKVQYSVTREKATEPPFTGRYASGHFKGNFVCVCCDAAHVKSELFSSQTKFDSGTGWPSFYQAINNKAVQSAWDYSGLEPRLEVTCRRCGAHLGHVFDDGPGPDGLRFCINSAAIKLDSAETPASSKPAATKTTSKSKAKAKSSAAAKSTPAANPPENSTDHS